MTTPNKQEIKYEIDPEIKKKTGAYPIIDVKMVPVNLHTTTDILKGGQRKRKFGMVMSIAIVPGLDQEQDPLLLAPEMPTMFFDADSIEDLQERAEAELKGMIEATKDQLKDESSGTTDTRSKAIH